MSAVSIIVTGRSGVLFCTRASHYWTYNYGESGATRAVAGCIGNVRGLPAGALPLRWVVRSGRVRILRAGPRLVARDDGRAAAVICPLFEPGISLARRLPSTHHRWVHNWGFGDLGRLGAERHYDGGNPPACALA